MEQLTFPYFTEDMNYVFLVCTLYLIPDMKEAYINNLLSIYLRNELYYDHTSTVELHLYI